MLGVMRRILVSRVIASLYTVAAAILYFLVMFTDQAEPLAGVFLTILIIPWSLFMLFLVGGLGLDSPIFGALFVAAAIIVNSALLFSLSARPKADRAGR